MAVLFKVDWLREEFGEFLDCPKLEEYALHDEVDVWLTNTSNLQPGQHPCTGVGPWLWAGGWFCKRGDD